MPSLLWLASTGLIHQRLSQALGVDAHTTHACLLGCGWRRVACNAIGEPGACGSVFNSMQSLAGLLRML